jgi:hypothetical protein
MRCRLLDGLRFGTPIIVVYQYLKFQFIQFVPRGRSHSGITAIGVLALTNGRDWQTAAFRIAQRMLRKLQKNIFPDVWGQVHAIINDAHRILTFQGQMGGPWVQREGKAEWFEAPDAGALQVQVQPALREEPPFEFLDLELVVERPVQLDDLVPRVDIELCDWQLAFQNYRVRLEVAQIHRQ